MTYTYKRGDTELVAALARGCGTSEAAACAGISHTTLRKRTSDPHFMKEVSKQRYRCLNRTAGILADLSTLAARRLRELMVDDGVPEHVVANACRTVLDYTMRLREGMDLDDRITELEELLDQEFVEEEVSL